MSDPSDRLVVTADDPALLNAIASQQLDEAISRVATMCLSAATPCQADAFIQPTASTPGMIRKVRERRGALLDVSSLFVREWDDLEMMANSLLVITSDETRSMLRCIMSDDRFRQWLESMLHEVLIPS